MSNKEYLTVAEYAKIKKVSTASVYKRLKTSFKPFLIEVEGKKCLKIEVLGNGVDNEVEKVINQVDNEVDKVDNLDSTFLKQQIQEKDKQIEKLQNQIILLNEAAREREKHIQEQGERLAQLLAQSQELQRNNQVLMLTANEEQKKSIWKRLFGKK